ncbi:MAG TPA: leucyl/phenylalanyl-tRNA--protein transferase [Phaeodactylibacter sp.]|nr:leucyl/phenylalanyl-tRNA--protein transferase [Phaeodactylibacter sp.]
MPLFRLSPNDIAFPNPEWSLPDGLLAVGGDLRPERLLEAYRQGIFPWYNPNDPILWWSPDPRMVLFPERLKISRSMRPYFNQGKFTLSMDTAFEQVMRGCATSPRAKEQGGGTWINEEMIAAYTRLHEMGYAHSVEVWEKGEMVGGLYGIALGRVFFGESMFSLRPNASKFGFIHLVLQLEQQGFRLIDCQQETRHLRSLGAENISRNRFLRLVEDAIKLPPLPAPWSVEKVPLPWKRP